MIEINNLTTVQVDEEFLKKICQQVLDGENKKDIDNQLDSVSEAISQLIEQLKKFIGN